MLAVTALLSSSVAQLRAEFTLPPSFSLRGGGQRKRGRDGERAGGVRGKEGGRGRTG